MTINDLLELHRAGWTKDEIMALTRAETPAPHVQQETPAQQVQPETPAQQVPPETPAQQVPPETPAPQVQPETPANTRPEWFNDIMSGINEIKNATRRQNIADFTQPNNEAHSDDVAKIISRYI